MENVLKRLNELDQFNTVARPKERLRNFNRKVEVWLKKKKMKNAIEQERLEDNIEEIKKLKETLDECEERFVKYNLPKRYVERVQEFMETTWRGEAKKNRAKGYWNLSELMRKIDTTEEDGRVVLVERRVKKKSLQLMMESAENDYVPADDSERSLALADERYLSMESNLRYIFQNSLAALNLKMNGLRVELVVLLSVPNHEEEKARNFAEETMAVGVQNNLILLMLIQILHLLYGKQSHSLVPTLTSRLKIKFAFFQFIDTNLWFK